jgi:hypothetical protein
MVVVDDRSGGVERTPLVGLRAPREIRVLEEREVALVEATHLVEHLPPQQRGPAGGAEYLVRLMPPELAYVGPYEPVRRHPDPVELQPGRIEHLALIGEAHLRGHGAHARV